ncbi:MAG: hypothetical protein R3B70_27130 [Polyangiaceae bacterium]
MAGRGEGADARPCARRAGGRRRRAGLLQRAGEVFEDVRAEQGRRAREEGTRQGSQHAARERAVPPALSEQDPLVFEVPGDGPEVPAGSHSGACIQPWISPIRRGLDGVGELEGDPELADRTHHPRQVEASRLEQREREARLRDARDVGAGEARAGRRVELAEEGVVHRRRGGLLVQVAAGSRGPRRPVQRGHRALRPAAPQVPARVGFANRPLVLGGRGQQLHHSPGVLGRRGGAGGRGPGGSASIERRGRGAGGGTSHVRERRAARGARGPAH